MTACRMQCTEIITQLTGRFTGEISTLKHRMNALMKTIQELESDKVLLTKSCRDILNQAANDVERIDGVMKDADVKISVLDQSLKHTNKMYDGLLSENREYKAKVIEMSSELDSLKEQVKQMSEQNCLSEYTNDEYRMLLEVALYKLQILEEAMVDKKKLKRSKQSVDSKVLSRDTKSESGSFLDNLIGHRKLRSVSPAMRRDNSLDNESQRSFDTQTSDYSAHLNSDPSRLYSDVSSLTNLTNNSDGLMFDKERRKLPRSVSTDFLQSRKLGERLPTITDTEITPIYKTQSGLNIKHDYQTAIDQTYSKIQKKSSFLEKKIALPVKSRSFEDPSRDTDKLSLQSLALSHNSEKEQIKKSSPATKIRRHFSFGGLGKKSGFKLFAKDKEKRLKQRRRSKTMDLSGLSIAPGASKEKLNDMTTDHSSGDELY